MSAEGMVSRRYDRAARSATAVACVAVFGALIALIPQLIIAAKFGLGGISDAYFMSAAILLTLVKVLEVQTLPKLYITIFAEYLNRPKKLEEVVSNLLHVSLIVFGALVPVLILVCPMLVTVLAPGFDADTKALTVYLLRLTAAALLFVPVSGLFTAVLHSFERFTVVSAVQLIPGTIMAVFTLATVDALGISSLALGNLLGYAVHVVALYLCLIALGLRHRWVLDPWSRDVRTTGRLLLPFMLVSVFDQAGGLFSNVIASLLPGGSFSALVMARKIRSYILAIVFETIPTIMYPSMAKSSLARNREHLRRLLLDGLRMIHFLTFPVLVLVVILSYDLVGLVFRRGAFDEAATRNVATCLTFLAVGLLPGGLSVLFSRALFALQDTIWINRTTVITSISQIFLSVVMVYFWGLFGLAAAIATHTLLNVVQYYIRLRPIIELKTVLFDPSFIQAFIISLCMGVVSFSFNKYLLAEFEFAGLAGKLIHIGSVTGVGMGVYGLLAYLAGVEEFRILARVVVDSRQRVSALLFKHLV